jgi:hypothetical protein
MITIELLGVSGLRAGEREAQLDADSPATALSGPARLCHLALLVRTIAPIGAQDGAGRQQRHLRHDFVRHPTRTLAEMDRAGVTGD